MTQYEKYGAIALLILVITPLSNYTIQPIFQVVIPHVFVFLDSIIAPIFWPFYNFLSEEDFTYDREKRKKSVLIS